jgi:GrpB-like predicted nucleotidyltransferase (UPF0157 family)
MRQDPIRMYPSDPGWAASFESERQRLTPTLETWLAQPLEHVGSTAVPGLVAKPIIDIVAVVESIAPVAGAAGRLGEIGWVAAPEPGDDTARKLQFCTPSTELRTHHMHIVERESCGWRGWLVFRDYLRSHPDLATEYGELKTRLANEHGWHSNQRDAYRAGKAEWVRVVTLRAFSSRE